MRQSTARFRADLDPVLPSLAKGRSAPACGGITPAVPALSTDAPLLLGSASPRRRELLASAGVPLVVVAPTVDERVVPGEAPLAYLERVTAAKLAAARALAGARALPRPRAVLVADTTVVLADAILDKPATPEAARALLLALSGATHDVRTRFVLGAADDEAVLAAETVTTRVTFRSLGEDEIDAYVASGEPFDKAGGYGIQGGAAGFVLRIEGSYTSVVGLPLAEVIRALRVTGLLPCAT